MLCFWLYFLVLVRCDSFQLSSRGSCPGGPSFTSAGEVVVSSARATARTRAQTALGAVEAISALCIAMLRKTAGHHGHDILESLEHDEQILKLPRLLGHAWWHGGLQVSEKWRQVNVEFSDVVSFWVEESSVYGDSGASQRCWALNASLIWPNSPRKLVCSGLCQHRVGGSFDGNIWQSNG